MVKYVLFLIFVNTITKLSIPCKARNISRNLDIYHVIKQDGAVGTVESMVDT
jgi:DNA-binding protein